MSDATLSVVIVNYRAGTMLADCVRSVLSAAVPAAIYVSDNGSEDGSIAHLLATAGDDRRVRIISNGRNLGFAQGNSVAFAQCRSEYILCLNPDAVLAQGALERLLARAQREPGFGFFATRMIQSARADLLDGAGDAYHASGVAWRRGHGSPAGDRRYEAATEVFSACAAAALYRREALEAVGGFDGDFFCYLEDVDLGFRLRLAGYRCLYVPEALVYHVGSATTGRDSDFAVYHGHRNLVWTYVKNMPGWLFWAYLPLHIVANLYFIVHYGFKGRWRVILKSKLDALRGLPAMWRKRRAVQAQRRAGARSVWAVMEKGWPRT